MIRYKFFYALKHLQVNDKTKIFNSDLQSHGCNNAIKCNNCLNFEADFFFFHLGENTTVARSLVAQQIGQCLMSSSNHIIISNFSIILTIAIALAGIHF